MKNQCTLQKSQKPSGNFRIRLFHCLFYAIAASLTLAMLIPASGQAAAPTRSDFLTEGMPYRAFDKLKTTNKKIANATLRIGFAPGKFDLPKQQIVDWLGDGANIVAGYYGQFPVDSARILIVPAPGRGVKGGQAFGYQGAAIRVYIGRQSRLADLKRDWVAIHEMIHLALPNVSRRHLWLSEGLAVYIESIARVQAGALPEEAIWSDFMRDMPKGLPTAGDRGLDHTPTWGRRYWGGALFCLLADIEIRKKTDNKMGLQTAMRALVAEGGNMEKIAPVKEIFRIADTATGHTVLKDQYNKMRATPITPDLATLWRDLGIRKKDGKITLTNQAPLAHIRRAILTPMP